MRTPAVVISVLVLAAAGEVDAAVLFPEGHTSLQRHHEQQVTGATHELNRSLKNDHWRARVRATLTASATHKHFVPPRKPLQHATSVFLSIAIANALRRQDTTITWRIKGDQKIPSVVAEATELHRSDLGLRFAELLSEGRISSLQSYFTTTVVHFKRRGTTPYQAPSLKSGVGEEELRRAFQRARIAAMQATASVESRGGGFRVPFGDSAWDLGVQTARNGGPPILVSGDGVSIGLDTNYALLSITTRLGAQIPR